MQRGSEELRRQLLGVHGQVYEAVSTELPGCRGYVLQFGALAIATAVNQTGLAVEQPVSAIKLRLYSTVRLAHSHVSPRSPASL